MAPVNSSNCCDAHSSATRMSASVRTTMQAAGICHDDLLMPSYHHSMISRKSSKRLLAWPPQTRSRSTWMTEKLRQGPSAKMKNETACGIWIRSRRGVSMHTRRNFSNQSNKNPRTSTSACWNFWRYFAKWRQRCSRQLKSKIMVCFQGRL